MVELRGKAGEYLLSSQLSMLELIGGGSLVAPRRDLHQAVADYVERPNV